MFFVLLGSVCAVDVTDASNTEDSNLTTDNVIALSQEKLEVSSENSISETNIVNSHDDNLNNCPEDSLKSIDESYYEDNGELKLSLVNENYGVAVSNEGVLADNKVSTSLSVSDTYYDNSGTHFKVTLQDKNGKALSNQNVTLKVNKKVYTGVTDKKGVADIQTAVLAVGQYDVLVSYAGNSNYLSSSLSKKVSVKKDKTSISGRTMTYILPYNYYTYQITLTSANGGPIKNCKVYFTYAGKTETATTDSNGKASTVIPLLDEGTYKITYSFKGTSGYSASSSSGTICIKSAENKFTASDMKMNYNDGSKFSVKFTDNNGKVLSGKSIRFILNNQNYYSNTNSKGIATLAIGDLKPGTYKIKFLYSTLGESDYNYGYRDIVINKLPAKLAAKDLSMKYNDGSEFKVKVKDSSGNILKKTAVKFEVNGKTYTEKTDAKGIAKLKISLPVGYYSIKSSVSTSLYEGSLTKHILVEGSKFVASKLNAKAGKTVCYSVKLVNGKDKPIKGATVKFAINGKKYTRTTDSSGIAKVKVGTFKHGKYKIQYAYGNAAKGASVINVIGKLSIQQIVTASKNLQSYVEKNHNLPSTVNIGCLAYTTADYLYLASKVIGYLKTNKNLDAPYKSIKSPSKPGAASNMGNLNNYLAVAKSVVKTADTKGQMPNYVSSSVGDIGYKGVVYAFARVLAYYGSHNSLPDSIAIKSLTSTSYPGKLNSKNTITNLAPYLAASTNCQVNNAKIKQLVSKLTSGLSSEDSKAKAIYNYVRDTISYSFYYDTRYGAVGTLDAKTGNCVDHSHLLVAMYRAAGLPARYVHGTCTFTSGTYGHVWTQVLLGDTWVVADATSARNSFGKVVNWNEDSYSLKGYYASISF